MIAIDRERCIGDGFCVRVCPMRDFRLEEGKARLVEPEQFVCINCGHCVAVCPTAAIRLEGDASEAIPAEEPETLSGYAERLMKTRRSTRWYLPRPVENATVEQALDVARYAPTGKNAQAVEWTAVNNPATLHTVGELTARWLVQHPARSMVAKAWFEGVDRILRGAPCLVLAHAPADYDLSPQDCAAAVSYLELILHARGLGSCWCGYVIGACAASAELRDLLAVGEGRAVFGGLMVGYSGERYRRIPGRKPAKIVWR